MRALAVLAVLIYHLHGPWLPGGFVGVDVFFVISGFVVSASIASFRGRGLLQFLAYFYARRIKRIFPALIVCLLVTAYVTALFVPASWLSAVKPEDRAIRFSRLEQLHPGADRTRLFRADDRVQPLYAYLVTGGRRTVLPGLSAHVPGLAQWR